MSLPQCNLPDPAARKPIWTPPAHAVDAHMHVFGDPTRYPLSPQRLFEPPAVGWSDYLHTLEALGIERAVLVHSAVYGTEHSVTADAMATDPDRFRGVALVSETLTENDFESLTAQGFRGFRINLVSRRGLQLEAARRMADRVRSFGWHAQFLMNIEEFPDLDRMFADFPVDVVIDHMGRPDPVRGPDTPAFQALIKLLQNGKGWSKISAPYRTSRSPPGYADMRPFADALVATASDRLVWGTDWPHVMVSGGMPNDGDLCNQLHEWVSDASLRDRILIDNPCALYGFSRPSPK